MPNFGKLIEVFQEARKLVSRSGNDYSWSSWQDAAHAVQEIDFLLSKLLNGEIPAQAEVVFLPFGPMQELSLSSGWADEFLKLADRFDSARSDAPCACINHRQSDLRQIEALGMDDQFAEVSVLECPKCGQMWLRWFYEDEAISRSGRWFECPISAQNRQKLTAQNALKMLNRKPWRFYGGSYFQDTGRTLAAAHT